MNTDLYNVSVYIVTRSFYVILDFSQFFSGCWHSISFLLAVKAELI